MASRARRLFSLTGGWAVTYGQFWVFGAQAAETIESWTELHAAGRYPPMRARMSRKGAPPQAEVTKSL